MSRSIKKLSFAANNVRSFVKKRGRRFLFFNIALRANGNMIELLLSNALGDLSADESRETRLDQGGGETKTATADLSPTMWAITIFLSLWAAYLSWTCNTKRSIPPVMKVVYAFFAFLFGGLYLFMYTFMTWGYCCPPLVLSVFGEPLQGTTRPLPMQQFKYAS
jgi:hypothetical protein